MCFARLFPVVVTLLGACAAPPKGDPAPVVIASASGVPAASDGPVTPAPPPDKPLPWDREEVGGLGAGTGEAEVLRLLGPPEKKSESMEEGATGEHVRSWEYPSKGISMLMTAVNAEGPSSIRNVTFSGSSKLQTSHGIGIGSSVAEVEKAYAGDINREHNGEGRIVVGEYFGGIKIDIEGGKVTSITLGTDGE